MSSGPKCKCIERRIYPLAKRNWIVTTYKANYSVFNGGIRTASAYSEVQCHRCGERWRTKGAYVDQLRKQTGA